MGSLEPKPLAAFNEINAPDTPGYMWRSSWYVFVLSVIVTGSLPSGVMLKPLTVLGLMSEGNMLSMCWLNISSTFCPAADMSAPESGSTSR